MKEAARQLLIDFLKESGLNELAKKTKTGFYDDISKLMQLVKDLKEAGRSDIAVHLEKAIETLDKTKSLN